MTIFIETNHFHIVSLALNIEICKILRNRMIILNKIMKVIELATT